MRIVWDERKRKANLAKHGLDFADFVLAFDLATAIIIPARPSRNGRSRMTAVGSWNGAMLVAAIVSPLGSEGFALVSLRRASGKERVLYDRA